MKKLLSLSAILSALIISTNLFAQVTYSEHQLKEVAKKVIANSQSCNLITLDKTGAPRARAMDSFPVEDDFTVWFGTNSISRKVKQIEKDSRVTLYFLSKDNSGYVVIAGEATLVNDENLKEKYWKKEWRQFYPDKKKNYLLIKVETKWLEVLSPPHGINNDPVTWEPPVIEF